MTAHIVFEAWDPDRPATEVLRLAATARLKPVHHVSTMAVLAGAFVSSVLIGVVQGISPSLEEAAQTMRAKRWTVFSTVTRTVSESAGPISRFASHSRGTAASRSIGKPSTT